MSQMDIHLYNAAMEKLANLGGLQASYVADAAGADASERASQLAGDRAREDEEAGLIDDLFGQGADANRMINKRKRHANAAFAENDAARLLNLVDPSQLLTESPDQTLTGLAMVAGRKNKDREGRVLDQYKDIINKYQDPVKMDGEKTTRETPYHLMSQGTLADQDMDIAGHKQQRKEHPLNYWLNPLDRTGPMHELGNRFQRRIGASIAEPDSALGRFGMGAGNVGTLGLLGALTGGEDAQNKLRRSAVDNEIFDEHSMPKGADKSDKPKDGDGDGKVNDGTEEEKEANIKSLYNLGKSGLSQLGQKLKLPAVGAAGLGLGGIAGNEVGKIKGNAAGDAAGYARGSAEGGDEAMQSLFNGLIDLRQRGSKMKPKNMPFIHTGTNPYGPTSERAALERLYKESSSCTSSHRAKKKKKKEVKEAALQIATKVAAYRRVREKQAQASRIKLASHVLNLHLLRQELETYDPYQLSKSAAVGARKSERLKAAALIRQIELEKQAVIGSIIGAGLGAVGRGAAGAAKGGIKAGLRAGYKGLKGGARAGFGVDKAMANSAYNMGRRAINTGIRGGASALNMAGKGISGGARGMTQGAKNGGGLIGAAKGAVGGAARGVGRAVKADPLAGTTLLGGGAMAGGAYAQNQYNQHGQKPMQQAQQMIAQVPQQVSQAAQQAPAAAGNYFSNLGNAFMGQ